MSDICEKCGQPMAFPSVAGTVCIQCQESELGASAGSTLAPEVTKPLLEQIYQWLNDGDMSDWGKRCHYHETLGKILGKPPVKYGE